MENVERRDFLKNAANVVYTAPIVIALGTLTGVDAKGGNNKNGSKLIGKRDKIDNLDRLDKIIKDKGWE